MTNTISASAGRGIAGTGAPQHIQRTREAGKKGTTSLEVLREELGL